VSRLGKLFARAVTGPDWPGWAAAHGWVYEEKAPELLGVFLPPPPGERSGEEIRHVVRGEYGGLPFISFVRQTWGAPKTSGSANYDYDGYLAVDLGRPLAPSLLAVAPAAAFKALGGSLTGPYDFVWHEDQWLLGVGATEPQEAEGTLQQISTYVSLAPPEVWRSS
jgi:hypothetical protein